MKRHSVPTALYAQLVECASLVRVLRTSRTLDLTAHLIEHARKEKNEVDTWTAWPLIDCPVPEWTLEDEIQQLGETLVRKSTQGSREADSDSDSDSQVSPGAMNQLVLHAGAVLVHILNLLADQRPSVPGSMQNRLWPMNWEDVISLLAVGGVVDPTVVARAEKRLERIYGPSSTKAIQRLMSATSAKATYASLAAVEDDHLFASPVLSRPHRSDGKGNTGPRHKRGIKTYAALNTETETDA